MTEDMMRQLRILEIERRPEACLGCGYEYNCSTRGCAVIRAAREQIQDIAQAADDVETKTQPEDSFSRGAVLEILRGEASGREQ